jgi:ribosomal protein L29
MEGNKMKRIVILTQQSNEQLNNQLNEIAISERRSKAYSSANRDRAAKHGGGENTMYLGDLRKEKARILTILNERKQRKVVA